MRCILISLTLVLFFHPVLMCQVDYTWWEQKHNWDGTSHFTSYMKFAPAYMGPNALPVPEIKTGTFDNNIMIENSVDFYFSNGDQTQDAYHKLFIPIVKDRIALEGYVMSFEHFKTDTITRDLRAARDYDCEGISGGDIYIGTLVRIVRNRKIMPDIMLGINIKTASGTNIENARHTDSPGYFFDLSAGKTFNLEKKTFKAIRISATVGFYSYQIYHEKYYQNDAFMYGGCLGITLGKIIIENKLGGYAGFLHDGDAPLVYRLIAGINKESFSMKIMFQHGINDYPFSSLRLSLIYKISQERLKNKFSVKREKTE